MRPKNVLAKVLSLIVVAGTLASYPASYAQAQKPGNPLNRAARRSINPATTGQSDPTPSVQIRMQIAGLPNAGQDIDVFAYEQETSYDLSSLGGPGGGGGAPKLMAGPVTVSKRIDDLSPILNRIHVSAQHIPEITMQWFRVDPSGRSGQLFFTIKLTDVVIASIHRSLPNQQDPAFARLAEVEAVSFVYQSIDYTAAGLPA